MEFLKEKIQRNITKRSRWFFIYNLLSYKVNLIQKI